MITLIISSKTDVAKLFDSIEFNRNHLSFLPWAKTITKESLEHFIENKLKSNDILYTILHYEDGPIGIIDLRVNGRIIDLGYWIGAKHAQNGFMKKALSILISTWDSLKYDKVVAKVKIENIASIKVLTSSGFQLLNSDFEWNYYELNLNRLF